jgi:hypothetical protein
MEDIVKKSFFIKMFVLCLGIPFLSWAAHGEILTGVEVGAGYQSRNDVRIPGDTGTGFSLKEIQGSGPVPVVRAWGEWRFADKHGLRLTAAPVRIEGTGMLDEDVFFVDKTFAKARRSRPAINSTRIDLLTATDFIKARNGTGPGGGRCSCATPKSPWNRKVSTRPQATSERFLFCTYPAFGR